MKGTSLGMALPVRFGLALYSELTSTVDLERVIGQSQGYCFDQRKLILSIDKINFRSKRISS